MHYLRGARRVGAVAAIFLIFGDPAEALEIDSAEVRSLYCKYIDREEKVIQTIAAEMGANPNEGLRAGDVLLLDGEATMAPSLGLRFATVEEAIEAITSLVRIQPGNTIEIVDRVHDEYGRLHYLAIWRERSVAGFINALSMSWLNNDIERLSAHSKAFDSAVEARMEVVDEDLFAPHGIDPNEVLMRGAMETWSRDC